MTKVEITLEIPNGFYKYKGKLYSVGSVDQDTLVQDPYGDWVPSVYYRDEPPESGKTFVRAITDFAEKFDSVR